MKPLDYSRPPEDPSPGHPEYLEIDLGRPRRWKGTILYVLFYLIVCGALTWFLVELRTPLRVAIGIVIFMVLYMTLMARWASKNVERHRQEDRNGPWPP